MGRKPIRLEKALNILSLSADANGYVENPNHFLHLESMLDGSTLIRKLAESHKLEICGETQCGRITSIKILPFLPDINRSKKIENAESINSYIATAPVEKNTALENPKNFSPAALPATPSETAQLPKNIELREADNQIAHKEAGPAYPKTEEPFPPAQTCRNRVMVLLDLENLYITLERRGHQLDINKLLDSCQHHECLIQFLSFVSLDAYQRSESEMVKIISQGMPITIVKNGKNSADATIISSIEQALRYDLADMFIIGTNDRGQNYLAAARKIKAHNKNFRWLSTIKMDRESPIALQSSNGYIYVAPIDNKKYEFNDSVRQWVKRGYLETNTPTEKFVKEVISIIYHKLPRQFPLRFYQVVHNIWNKLDCKTRAEFRQVDCEYVINALHKISGVIRHNSITEHGKTVELLYLDDKHPLLAKLNL